MISSVDPNPQRLLIRILTTSFNKNAPTRFLPHSITKLFLWMKKCQEPSIRLLRRLPATVLPPMPYVNLLDLER